MSQPAAPDRVRFDNPPVVETILGVAFPALPGWGAQHLGLYWAAQKGRFPHFEQQPPLPPVSALGGAFLQIGATPQTRGRYIDATKTRVLQVQNDRFNYGWRKITPDDRYPLYENILPEFEREWAYFQRFLRENDLPPANPQGLEVTYINHILRGAGWNNLGELGKVFRAWCGDCLVGDRGFQSLANASITTVYTTADAKQVRYDIHPGIRATDGQELLQFTVTVSQFGPFAELNPIVQWFNAAQKVLVDSFVQYTTPDVQNQVWGRQA